MFRDYSSAAASRFQQAMSKRKSKNKKRKSVAQTAELTSAEGQQEAAAASTGKHWIALLLLAAVVFGVYLHSCQFGFLYDDHKLILRQGRADSLDDFTRVFTQRHWDNLPYYRPVSRVTMVAQKWLHGDNAGPFHVFNTLLISICAVVVARLLSLSVFRIPFPLTIAGALIFALHPAASSVVYPICSGRETLIPAVFIVSAVALWIRGTTPCHVAAIVLLPFALLSKEQAIITPALFLVADWLRISNDAPSREFKAITRWLSRYAPVILIVVAYFMVRKLLFEGTNEHALNLWQHPEQPLLSLLYALQTTFAPFVDLHYEPEVSIWLKVPRVVIAVTFTLCLSWFVARAILKRNDPVESYPDQESAIPAVATLTEVVLFWLAWILCALAPTANILKQEAKFDERYVFLAIPGVIGIAGVALGTIWRRKHQRAPLLVTLGVIAVVCGAISFHRGSFFHDDQAFLKQWIKTNPSSEQAHLAMAEYFHLQGDDTTARGHLDRSLELNPASPGANNSIGLLLYQQGEPEIALQYLERALKQSPEYADAHNNYAVALSMLGRYDEAIPHYREAIRINPNYVEPWFNQGVMYEQMKMYDEAIKSYQEAVSINPSSPDPYFGMGYLALLQNNVAEAEKHLQKTIQLDPQHTGALTNLGILREDQGDLVEAERLFRRTIELDPKNAIAHEHLRIISRQSEEP